MSEHVASKQESFVAKNAAIQKQSEKSSYKSSTKPAITTSLIKPTGTPDIQSDASAHFNFGDINIINTGQTNLAISQPGDIYKQKLDRASEKVKPMSSDSVGGHDRLRIPSIDSSAGEPLPKATREELEPLFGEDLGDVRLHNSVQTAESARRLRANAFAVGNDIYFGTGRLAPGTPNGMRLIAHEVAHSLQTRGTSVQPSSLMNTRRDPTEQEALKAAEEVMMEREVNIKRSSRAPMIHREEEGAVPATQTSQLRESHSYAIFFAGGKYWPCCGGIPRS